MYFSKIQRVGRVHYRSGADSIHKLIWDFFPGVAQGERPFVFRYEGQAEQACFYVVSQEPPRAPDERWRIASKPYQPQLAQGDLLEFSLKANPTVCVQTKRTDVVSYFFEKEPDTATNLRRNELEYRALQPWLKDRGLRNGFELEPEGFRIKTYETERFQRHKPERRDLVTLTTTVLEGQLTVTEPDRFTSMLYQGLGHGRGYGCGLMMVRRAKSWS